MASSPAERRYNRTVFILSVCYGAALIGAAALFKHHRLAGAIACCVAILPALPIVGIFAAIGRYLVDEGDEFLRMLMIRQALIASGAALSIATVWGFLESFDVAPHVEPYWIAVLWFGGLGLGACINKFTLGREA